MNLILCVDENIYLLLPQIFAYPGQKHWSQIIPINLNVNNVMCNKGVTHPFESFHLLRDDILQDKGEGHLVIIVQQRVNGFLQPHQLILFLEHTTNKQPLQAFSSRISLSSFWNTQQTNNHYKLSPAASAYPLSETQQTNNHYKLSPAASTYPLSETHNKQTTITSFLQPHQLILFLEHTTNKQPLQAFSSRLSLSSF